ncbi:MAG: sulfur reduction protein DsrS [Gammaproteobacteria bacterium]
MELSLEDALRLNVLLANPLQAIRIDESSMVVYALSEEGEASIRLNPQGRDDRYLKKVRETLSSQVLGSPGGYPVFLRRWTRMGQARNDSLEQLLLLGEPEAVVAVVHAQGLSDEIARRAWWAMPVADNARRMLENEAVVNGAMGPELANYLIEYLPFETEHRSMLETVRLILQPGLISAEAKNKLWSAAKRRNTFYVGFMQTIPDGLPDIVAPAALWVETHEKLEPLIVSNNPVAIQLDRCLSAPGQAFMRVVEKAFNKPNNQDVVVELLKAVQSYFSSVCPNGDAAADILTMIEDADVLCDVPAVCPTTRAVREVLDAAPELEQQVQAMLVLSWVGEPLINPVFSRTDSIGSVMRKKIEPVTTPLLKQIAYLRTAAESE